MCKNKPWYFQTFCPHKPFLTVWCLLLLWTGINSMLASWLLKYCIISECTRVHVCTTRALATHARIRDCMDSRTACSTRVCPAVRMVHAATNDVDVVTAAPRVPTIKTEHENVPASLNPLPSPKLSLNIWELQMFRTSCRPSTTISFHIFDAFNCINTAICCCCHSGKR